jgi:hypothetical protein
MLHEETLLVELLQKGERKKTTRITREQKEADCACFSEHTLISAVCSSDVKLTPGPHCA